MLTTVFAKTIRDRWRPMAIGAGLVALWLPMAMAIYRDIDLTVYTDLPEGLRELMGIPAGADAAALSYNVMLEFAAALTLAGMAVSMGSAAIAGEERNGTIGLLLANPKSRTHIAAAKAGAMLLLLAVASTALWVSAIAAPRLLGVEIGGARVGAMMVHLFVNAAFYGLMAMAVGGWTGNRALSSGLPAGVMVVSYFAVGLLPLVESIADAARVFPWYYFSAGEPLVNGVQWGHLGVLVVGAVVLFGMSLIGLNRRDLKGPAVGVSLLDRLRDNPRSRRVFERLAGSTRVSHLWVKTTSEHQMLLFITAAVMFVVMGVLMGPMYIATGENLADVDDQFPESLLAIAGGGDFASPEGWFRAETFSLTAPIAIMIVTVVIGAKALAGEEANGTMGLLLANPIKRSRIVGENAFAMAIYGAVVGASTFAGVAVANLISGLEMSYVAIAAASILVTLLGLVFGSVALMLGAATGETKVAIYGTTGLALTSHLLNAFLPLSERLSGWARLTPNHYYLGSDPLSNGMDWGHAGVLAALTIAFIALAVAFFDRRDLRQG